MLSRTRGITSMVAVALVTAVVTALTMSSSSFGLRLASAWAPDTGFQIGEVLDTSVRIAPTSVRMAPTSAGIAASAARPRSAAPASPVMVTTAKATGVFESGTTIKARMTTRISSRTAAVGDPVTAVTVQPLIIGSKTIYPAGTRIQGYVSEVQSARETRSAAHLAVRFTRLGGERVAMSLVSPDLEARARQANTAADIGLVAGGAVLGGVLGHQVDHKKGKEIGAIVGGLAGAATAAQVGANVQLKLDETIVVRLDENMVVTKE